MSPATVTKLLTILDYSVVSLVFNIFFFIVLKFLLVFFFPAQRFLFIMAFLCFFVHFSGIFTAPLTGLAYILHHWTTITGFQFFFFFYG